MRDLTVRRTLDPPTASVNRETWNNPPSRGYKRLAFDRRWPTILVQGAYLCLRIVDWVQARWDNRSPFDGLAAI